MTRVRTSLPGALAGQRPSGGRRFGVRTALVAGFGVIVVLWLVAVIDLAYRVREADRQLDAMTGLFIQTEDALQTLRTSVLLAAIDWRDAFLDTDAEQIPAYRSLLLDHRRECARVLAALRASEDEWIARDALNALDQEVGAYWAGVMPLIEMAPMRQAVQARRLLNERVIPKRALVVSIVRQVQQLNRSRFQRQQRETAAVYTRAQSRVAVSGGLATLLSLLVGAVVFVHISGLERQVRAELAANAEITADLHRLSARVVRAQEDERRLIARELHDEVGQALTAVKMQLAVVGRAVGDSQRRGLDEARSIVDAALQSARNLSRLLHPPMLDDIGLAAAVEWYLRGFSERTGVAITFEHAGTEQRAAPEIETCLFRVVQEATTNVARHADAASCRVYLQRLPDSVVLTIEDDGRGFEPSAHRPGEQDGLGLLGIQERISGFRGLFRLDSGPGRGTRITVELPALDAALPKASSPDEEGTTDGPDTAR